MKKTLLVIALCALVSAVVAAVLGGAALAGAFAGHDTHRTSAQGTLAAAAAPAAHHRHAAARSERGERGRGGHEGTGDPYPGSVRTETHVSAKPHVKRNATNTLHVRVSAAGNARPSGAVYCTVRRSPTGFVQHFRSAYSGGTITFSTSSLPKAGTYTVQCSYRPHSGSVYQASVGTTSFTVGDGEGSAN